MRGCLIILNWKMGNSLCCIDLEYYRHPQNSHIQIKKEICVLLKREYREIQTNGICIQRTFRVSRKPSLFKNTLCYKKNTAKNVNARTKLAFGTIQSGKKQTINQTTQYVDFVTENPNLLDLSVGTIHQGNRQL